MNYVDIFCIGFISVFSFSCESKSNSVLEDKVPPDSEVQKSISEDHKLFEETFILVSRSLDKVSEMEDNFFKMQLPDDIKIDEDIIEIAVNIEGFQNTFLVNGLSIESASEKYPGGSYSVQSKVRIIKDRNVRVSIKILSTTI